MLSKRLPFLVGGCGSIFLLDPRSLSLFQTLMLIPFVSYDTINRPMRALPLALEGAGYEPTSNMDVSWRPFQNFHKTELTLRQWCHKNQDVPGAA